MLRPGIALVVLAVLGASVGCARIAEPAAPVTAYAGPLYLAPDDLTSDADRLTGAAGRAVSCRTRVTGDRDDPDQLHPGAPAATPEKALRVGYGEGRLSTSSDVLREQRRTTDRVLFTHLVDGVAKQAVIVHHGPTLDHRGKVGWYIETRARCDWAELPDGIVGFLGSTRFVWTGADGLRAPTYDVVSFPGAEHCDWQSMTFLTLAEMPDLIFYVRRPDTVLADYFAEPYRSDVAVPADAIDTGYARDGDHLWLAADRQRAYVGTADHAELWPITTQPLGCA